ncbi:MAG: hypothetical protein AAF431_15875 [Pseudomonadota bacterium]
MNNFKARFLPLIVLVFSGITGCAQNSPFRTGGIVEGCYEDLGQCRQAIVEKHLEFDLAYVEFTQRGNQFDRAKTEQVIDYINDHANSDKGAAVFVFVHGWKHNADSNDSNVANFREMLSRAAENPFVGPRRVIGLYLGWRGKVTSIPLVKELSYWGRKSVAEEIGSGGATEIFTDLQQVLIDQFDGVSSDGALHKNTFVIIGHSFGGAIVLSALHDVLLAELIAVARRRDSLNQRFCDKVKRFADGVILLNPAIEANRVILLREIASKCEFGDYQPQLMHVISSEADLATSRYFPIGQYANITSTLRPKNLKRTINGKEIILSESALDRTTAGNLDQLRTGYLYHDSKAGEWTYMSCRNGLDDCGVTDTQAQKNHIPVTEFDPISFIRTDANFIKDHNDVFSCYAQSYITTIMFETQAIDRGYVNLYAGDGEDSEVANCDHRDFNFSQCFNNQLYDYNCDLLN